MPIGQRCLLIPTPGFKKWWCSTVNQLFSELLYGLCEAYLNEYWISKESGSTIWKFWNIMMDAILMVWNTSQTMDAHRNQSSKWFSSPLSIDFIIATFSSPFFGALTHITWMVHQFFCWYKSWIPLLSYIFINKNLNSLPFNMVIVPFKYDKFEFYYLILKIQNFSPYHPCYKLLLFVCVESNM